MQSIGDLVEIVKIAEREKCIYEILKGCPLEILKELAIVISSRGKFILEQGAKYQSIYIVVSGLVGIYVMADDGRKYAITVCKKGSFIGEHEIFDCKPYSSQVEAISDVTLLEIKRVPFMKWIGMDRNFSDIFVRYLCQRMYSLTQKAGTDTLYSLRARICRYLISAPEQSGRISIRRGSLGELLGVTTRSVSRILKSLEDSGVIRIDSGQIVIQNFDALRKEVED
jgi:CRP-like cAMP-binding protein